jgi:TonB-dependent SusC/RagA subfamily outer membrane receptor
MKLNYKIQSKCHFNYGRVRSMLWITLLLFTPVLLMAQQRTFTVKGNIKDKTSSVPGVAVLQEGTTNGTVSDQDGNYQLSISSEKSSVNIVFSFIGYQTQLQTVTLGTQEIITLEVTLNEDVKQLDEVIVTGSTLKTAKRELGNNISTVNSSTLEKSGSNNLFGALQGKLPGAQITQNSGDPSGGMTIRLRGVKSILGSSDPLYVIDGVVVSNTTVNVSQTALNGQVATESIGNNRLVDVNPADIETLSVLNGAAAAAQYGSRASNGVIIITTKRGKSGTPKFTFSTSININELRKKVPHYNL